MSDDKIKEQKEFMCTACGKIITATKFASAKTIRCKECKESDRPIDPSIVESAIGSTEKKGNTQRHEGSTKILPCVKCGRDTEVTKFASAAKVLCNECKGSTTDADGNILPIKVDLSKVDKNTMPSIEEYFLMPSIIANPRLRQVQCPACNTPNMKILGILDYSAYGLIIHYQCTNCFALVSVSEQPDKLSKTYKPGIMYDYSGNAIDDMISPLQSARLYNTLKTLIQKLKDHNIPIEGIKLPPYQYINDRPVEVGYIIPDGDEDIKAISDAISMLNEDHDGDGRIEIDSPTAHKMSERLGSILKRK